MPSYRFAVHRGANHVERLGSMAFADDAEAIVFGKRIIRDMKERESAYYVGWTMDIKEGLRTVDSVLFDAVEFET
jgi:hypothetical protein